jgi:hypothetical protein
MDADVIAPTDSSPTRLSSNLRATTLRDGMLTIKQFNGTPMAALSI